MRGTARCDYDGLAPMWLPDNLQRQLIVQELITNGPHHTNGCVLGYRGFRHNCTTLGGLPRHRTCKCEHYNPCPEGNRLLKPHCRTCGESPFFQAPKSEKPVMPRLDWTFTG